MVITALYTYLNQVKLTLLSTVKAITTSYMKDIESYEPEFNFLNFINSDMTIGSFEVDNMVNIALIFSSDQEGNIHIHVQKAV